MYRPSRLFASVDELTNMINLWGKAGIAIWCRDGYLGKVVGSVSLKAKFHLDQYGSQSNLNQLDFSFSISFFMKHNFNQPSVSSIDQYLFN